MEFERTFAYLVLILTSGAPIIFCEPRQQNVLKRLIKLDHDATLKSHSNCSGLEILEESQQPKYSADTSFIRKCCPFSQSYETAVNSNEETRKCSFDSQVFNVSILNATFYENCIEDNETGPKLNYTFSNACESKLNNVMIKYAQEYGDLLYVLQNGSLLVVDENFESYDIHPDYCLDVDREEGHLYAIVCVFKSNFQTRILRAEAYLYALCLWLSVPCLFVTVFFYVKIGELRNLHGKSLACHCTCLAVAYILLGIVQIQLNVAFTMTYFIQYSLISCICWLCVLCIDICIEILFMSCSEKTEDKFFATYAISSFGLPVLPVIGAFWKNTSGIPIYFIKGQHIYFNKGQHSGEYFIFPCAFLLFCCFCCLFIAFHAFGRRQSENPAELVKLKQTVKCVAILFTVMSICMLIEMITYHLNTAIASTESALSPFAFFDVLIALQGVFIFIIFVCSPTQLRIIKRWWINFGSLDTTTHTELDALK